MKEKRLIEVKIYLSANFKTMLDLLSSISFSGPVPTYSIKLKVFTPFIVNFYAQASREKICSKIEN